MKLKISGVLALLTVGLCVNVPASHADTERWLPEVADSATLTGPIVAAGKVSNPKGTSFTRGAHVVLFALPSTEVTDQMKVGDSVTMNPVAKARVDGQGRYRLRVEELGALQRYANENGNVDFEVHATDGGFYAESSFTRELVGASTPSLREVDWEYVGTSPKAARTQARTSYEPIVDTQVADMTSLPFNKQVAALSDGREQSGTMEKTLTCGQTLVKNFGGRNVTVGWTYAMARKTNSKFIYQQSSNSSLGVGYSASGKYGTFSQSGTVSRTSTDTIGYGKRHGAKRYGTSFRFGKYAQWCRNVYDPPSSNKVHSYKVRANKFLGGNSIAKGTVPRARHCQPLYGGTHYTKDDTRAMSWSVGANTAGAIGINLSARTGFTSRSKLRSNNAGSATRRLCGTNDHPGGAPRRLVTKR